MVGMLDGFTTALLPAVRRCNIAVGAFLPGIRLVANVSVVKVFVDFVLMVVGDIVENRKTKGKHNHTFEARKEKDEKYKINNKII